MRLRHIKGADEIVNKSEYTIIDPKQHMGNWKQVFNNDNPIYIEIGMGKGNFIVENAKRYPNINFIGIEKYYSVIVKAINNLNNYEISNLKIIAYDANYINEIFKDEIDLIYLNFSDPWPKNRHERRRLTSLDFLKRYDDVFKEKKHIIMKTDNRKLFEYSIISFNNYDYKINEICLDLYKENIENNIPTEYEIKFMTKGFPIYKIDTEK